MYYGTLKLTCLIYGGPEFISFLPTTVTVIAVFYELFLLTELCSLVCLRINSLAASKFNVNHALTCMVFISIIFLSLLWIYEEPHLTLSHWDGTVFIGFLWFVLRLRKSGVDC